MTDHLYREIEKLRQDNDALSRALADMIDMYQTKKRNGIRLGNARAALTRCGKWPESPQSENENGNT